ncbi:MAG: hypothetical protein RLZZ416_505 [Candidatus Parcubacteria bacterium]|jgi:hypothetical protein
MKHSVGWSSTPQTAPVADESLIARACSEALEPGQRLGALFNKPSDRAKAFLEGLSTRARAALENAAREEKHVPEPVAPAWNIGD